MTVDLQALLADVERLANEQPQLKSYNREYDESPEYRWRGEAKRSLRQLAAAVRELMGKAEAGAEDGERLDWMQANSATVEVSDNESASCEVQSMTDYTISGSAASYDIREAINDAMHQMPNLLPISPAPHPFTGGEVTEHDAMVAEIESLRAQVRALAKDGERLRKELTHLVRLLEPLETGGGLDVPGLATLNGARAAITAEASGE